MAPYIEIGDYEIPLDAIVLIVGLILLFFGRSLASYANTSLDLSTIGLGVLLVGIIIGLLGRVHLE
jgi:hypothetical protein